MAGLKLPTIIEVNLREDARSICSLPCLTVLNAALPVRSARAAIGEYLGVLFSYRRWGRVADHLHGFKPQTGIWFSGRSPSEILRVRIFTWILKGMITRAVSSSGFRRLALSSSRAVRPAPTFGWDGPRFGHPIQSRAWRPTAPKPQIFDQRSRFAPYDSLLLGGDARTSGLPWATSTPLRCPSASGPHPTTGPRLTET